MKIDLAYERVLTQFRADPSMFESLLEMARTVCSYNHHQRMFGCSIPNCPFYIMRGPDDEA